MSVKKFIDENYKHFNAAVIKDASQGWIDHLDKGNKMFFTMAGAMSTAELGISLAQMIREDKIHGISTTGANLEEDIFNLVAHDSYKRVPGYRYFTKEDEQELLDKEASLQHELDEFNREKEKIRNLLGSIGGSSKNKKENIINMVFLAVVVTFFTLELTTHFLPSAISLEIGVLLVSIKIIMLIHNANKANHFSFWILNSIEFRINEINKRTKTLEKDFKKIKSQLIEEES